MRHYQVEEQKRRGSGVLTSVLNSLAAKAALERPSRLSTLCPTLPKCLEVDPTFRFSSRIRLLLVSFIDY